MTAAGRWADELARWSIPQDLLDAVEESPYGWPQALWKRRSELARRETEETPTSEIVRALLGPTGTIIDVGAGRGRASLRLAAEGHPLTAVEKDAGMAHGLRDEARASGVDVTVIEKRWPDAETKVDRADVVLSAHVVYDVADIGAFVTALHRKANAGVVIELTPEHPWAPLTSYYRILHGLERPDGPTADDLAIVVEECVGLRPRLERWHREGLMLYADWDEIVETYGRRLVLPPARRDELRPLLEPDVTEVDGLLYVGDPDRTVVTIWWET